MGHQRISSPHVVLHLSDGNYEIVDLEDVYLLSAEGDATRVRLRGRRARTDVRPLGDFAKLEEKGFFRIHRSYLVNLSRIRMVRRRDIGRDWEVVLEPPVNRVLPVSRDALPGLMEALDA